MPAWLIPAAIAAGGLISNLVGQNKQRKHNLELARFQASANQKYLQDQLDYNTPRAQMMRFHDAGLNPNLIYGQGSPGNQQAPLSYPDVKPADMQSAFNLAPLLNQSMLTQSQVQATDAKTRQTHVLTQLNELQKRVLERNPSLDDATFKAILDGLKSSAEIKASESTIKGIESNFLNLDGFGKYGGMKMGEHKMFRELELLDQRFNLGSLDAQIKSQVLQSKEFQNALLEIQKKWMADGEITPQHILQFIQLFLLKIL